MHPRHAVTTATVGPDGLGETVGAAAAEPVAQLGDLPEVVPGLEALEVALHGRRERLVGRLRVREQRVATHGGHHERAGERAHGWVGEEALVGVPHGGGVALVRVEDADLLVALAEVGEEGMHLDLADAATERHVLVRRELGSPQQQHLVLDERGPQFGRIGIG